MWVNIIIIPVEEDGEEAISKPGMLEERDDCKSGGGRTRTPTRILGILLVQFQNATQRIHLRLLSMSWEPL